MMRLLFLFLIWGTLHAEVLCKGIVLLSNEDALLPQNELELMEGVFVLASESSTTPELLSLANLKTAELLASKIEKEFIGQPLDDKMIGHLRHTIEGFLRKKRFSLAKITIPQQEVSDGILQVRICESKIAEVQIEGTRYTSEEHLKQLLGVEEGDPVNTRTLRKNLDFINRNPFRQVDLIYSAGQAPQTTDISLFVKDRYPLRVYTGTDNSGVETTDRGRLFAGLNCSKVFNLDHFFAFQYTSSYDFHRFQAYTGQYIAYLDCRHVLNLYGGYSSLYADLPFPSTRNHGQSYQASGRYAVPLNPSQALVHEICFGFDFKRTNNTVEFAEIFPTVGPNVNLSQFILGYKGGLQKETCRIDFEGDLFYSPGAILPNESNLRYSALRTGAKNHWLCGKGLLKYFQKLPHAYALQFTARGQLSSQNLLPSEQIGLGGFDSVRGYDERQLNYDSGYILNTELLSPAFSIFSRWKKKKSWQDALQFLGFIDYGYGRDHTAIPGEKKKDHLLGIGPGVRYTLDPWITARLDLGVKMHRESTFTGGSAMWYFSFIGSL